MPSLGDEGRQGGAQISVGTVLMCLVLLSIGSRLASDGVASWILGEDPAGPLVIIGGLLLAVGSIVATGAILSGSGARTVFVLLLFALVWPILKWGTLAVYVLAEITLGSEVVSRWPAWRWVIREAKRKTRTLRTQP